MKADVLSLDGKKVKSIDLPEQFQEPFRPDLIKRAVLAVQSHKRQAYGAKVGAGMRQSAKLSRRRRQFKTSYGKGISRVPRKIMSRRGLNFNWVGAVAPGMVGGRKAHPPKAEKVWDHKLNIKEKKKAIRCAISATAMQEVVMQRQHVSVKVPYVLESKLEDIKKTQELESILGKIGLAAGAERGKERTVRSGQGKSRGRKYRKKKGVLFIVSKKCALLEAASNIGGEVVVVDSLNTELLAPGTHAGRLTVWTDQAIERLAKEKLFMERR